jgi:hypothetical protein
MAPSPVILFLTDHEAINILFPPDIVKNKRLKGENAE